MRRLLPDTIAARTLLVLIVGLTLFHVLSVAMYLTDRTSTLLSSSGEHLGERIATIDGLVENAPAAERRRIVALAEGRSFHVIWSRDSLIGDQTGGDWQMQLLRSALAAHLDSDGGRAFRVRRSQGTFPAAWQAHLRREHAADTLDDAVMVSLRLGDGSWLNFAAPVRSPQPFWSLRFALSTVVMLSGVIVFSVLVVRHFTKPFGGFARAARRLGVDVRAPPMAETGAAEMRAAARAFNEMQGRIRRFVEDRTQMIAAISHDLGTPITRLRLRAEFVEDEAQRVKMLADLDDMERMVATALSFARDDAICEPRVSVDLRTLVQRVCDDASDAGHEVAVALGDVAVPYRCRPGALRRALSNLVANAAKYGQRARVALTTEPDGLIIRIDDDGPGIPEASWDEAFQPFRRLETSRNRETGGTGLGLTVARTVIRAHGGEITLEHRAEGGLRVAVHLPRQETG